MDRRGWKSAMRQATGPAGTVVKCLVCTTTGAAAIVIPATAASASTSTAPAATAAVAATKPNVVPTVTCATVAQDEGLIGNWGIGAKATDDIPSVTQCISDSGSTGTPSVESAVAALANASGSTWWDRGGYPAPASLSSVINDLNTAGADLSSAASQLSKSTAYVNLVSAEQWIAYTAYCIDNRYLSALSSGGLSNLVTSLVDKAISQGAAQYQAGDYTAATKAFLGPLRVAYVFDPPEDLTPPLP